MTRLSELLTDANTAGVSARSIAREAQSLGFSLNHDTAARYLRGDHGRPDEDTLVAFAKVLRVPLTRLRQAAALPSEETEPYIPPAEASRLSRRQRRAVDEVIRAMVQPATGRQPLAAPAKKTAKQAVKRPAKRATPATARRGAK